MGIPSESSTVYRLLTHLSNAPSAEIFVSLSVIGESTIQCLVGEKTPNARHDLDELHDLVDFWAALDLRSRAFPPNHVDIKDNII